MLSISTVVLKLTNCQGNQLDLLLNSGQDLQSLVSTCSISIHTRLLLNKVCYNQAILKQSCFVTNIITMPHILPFLLYHVPPDPGRSVAYSAVCLWYQTFFSL